ncbi:AMP-binding protein [Sulfitobacter sp.]|uniref:AMP-binding protein n=1 Tax=Sulfitobacter sp. TaxID=1903071 RepID=UPI003F6C9509
MKVTLSTQLWRSFEVGGRTDFLISPETTLSYSEMQEGIRCWMALFDEAGLAQGDRFVLRTDRQETAISGFLAGLIDGVVPVLLEGSCPDQRLASIISAVDPKLVVSDANLPALEPTIMGQVLKTVERRRGPSALFRRKSGNDFGLGTKAASRAPRLPVDDTLAYLLFTSGTTAAPSGVEITRTNLAANLETLTRLGQFSGTSRIFNDMILAHADGMIQGPVLAAWNRAAVVRSGGFEVQKIEIWLSQIRQIRATHVLAVPTIWAMIDRYAAHDDYFDGPECAMLITVAAKMPADLLGRIEQRFGRPLVNHYGLTETVASALYSGNHTEMGTPGTIGKPVDCEARIEGGADEGELQLRGDNIFNGYWRNPDRTRQSFTDDGWFKTGDIARMREDGSFDYLGRLKTVIMSGGVLILPDEIDEALLRHPAVVESATVGVPDDMFGEIGMTGVVLSDPVDEPALVAHLRDHVEPRKIPKRIHVLSEIPRGLSGKVNTQALRAVLTDAPDSSQPTAHATNIQTDVLAIAAKVFRVPAEQLSLRSTPDDVEGWDSFTQLNLILSIEDHFDQQIPVARVSALRRLGDFVTALQDCE